MRSQSICLVVAPLGVATLFIMIKNKLLSPGVQNYGFL
nr:MAG TPA: hypothetical protein [Caudoviricetes sp.]DAU40797.1 MAG TPA: hypothetical protein [Caudoviricetes sp.]